MEILVNQFKALVKLPYAWKKDADAASAAYDTAKKLKVAQNQKDPLYGKRKPNQFGK